jgi:hypothetical protein
VKRFFEIVLAINQTGDMVLGMNLTNELKSKAQWVADLMKADKVTPEMVTPELALAYFDEAGRRIAKIQSTYLTRQGAKEAMQARILSIV